MNQFKHKEIALYFIAIMAFLSYNYFSATLVNISRLALLSFDNEYLFYTVIVLCEITSLLLVYFIFKFILKSDYNYKKKYFFSLLLLIILTSIRSSVNYFTPSILITLDADLDKYFQYKTVPILMKFGFKTLVLIAVSIKIFLGNENDNNPQIEIEKLS